MNPEIAVIDYRMGNLNSVRYAFESLGGCTVRLTSKAEDLESADAIILPGVGHYSEGMSNLRSLGLIETLEREVRQKNKKFLGICLGMQLLTESSEEGDGVGLGWVKTRVKKIPEGSEIRVPHVGWNEANFLTDSALFRGLEDQTDFYFVHSFFVESLPNITVAECDYGVRFSAALHSNNIYATQFHPERSHHEGLKVLSNFLGIVRNSLQ